MIRLCHIRLFWLIFTVLIALIAYILLPRMPKLHKVWVNKHHQDLLAKSIVLLMVTFVKAMTSELIPLFTGLLTEKSCHNMIKKGQSKPLLNTLTRATQRMKQIWQTPLTMELRIRKKKDMNRQLLYQMNLLWISKLDLLKQLLKKTPTVVSALIQTVRRITQGLSLWVWKLCLQCSWELL